MKEIIAELLPIALGEIGLSYDEFLKLTPRRWAYLYEGYFKKRNEESQMLWNMFAWQTAYILNISGKSVEHRITPEELLTGNKKEELREPERPEDIIVALKENIVI